MQLSHLAARHPAAILAYIHCGEMSVSVCACAATDALMSPPQQQHHYSNYSRHFSPEMKTPSAMRVEVAEVRARVHARLRKITPKASVCVCVRARADSPLVRLLLSMYIAQHSTNPVIKENVGVGRERLSRSTARRRNRVTHAHARRAHTRGRTGAQRNRSDPVGPHRLPDSPAPVSRLDPLGLAQRGCPVCARRAVAETERESGGRESEGERCRFHDNKLR